MSRPVIVIDRSALVERLLSRRGPLPGFQYPGDHHLREQIVYLLWLVVIERQGLKSNQVRAAIKPLASISDDDRRTFIADYVSHAIYLFRPTAAVGYRNRIRPQQAPTVRVSNPTEANDTAGLDIPVKIPPNQRWCPTGTR